MSIITNSTSIQPNTMRNVLNTLMQISFPYIFLVSILGICGNFLTIIMLSKRSLSKNFNSCTLIALALTDLIFNFTLLSRCIQDLIQLNTEQLCRVLSFLSHLAELLSACLTAHFTAQRFIAVRFPLSVFIEKRIHLLHYLIVLSCIIFSVMYCLALVKSNDYDNCHEELDLKWFISDALLSFLIPFTIITILNILIVLQLRKSFQYNQQFRFTKSHPESIENVSSDSRKQMSLSSQDIVFQTNFHSKHYDHRVVFNPKISLSFKQTNDEGSFLNGHSRSFNNIQCAPSIQSRSQSYRITRMLIIVSTCFLLLNAPAHICTIGFKMYTLQTPFTIENSNEVSLNHFRQSNQTTLSSTLNTPKFSTNQNESLTINHNVKWLQLFYIIIIITQHISYASYSINVFLYSFCGIKFRAELTRCISERRRQSATSRSL